MASVRSSRSTRDGMRGRSSLSSSLSSSFLLLAALIAPALFGLVGSEIGARRVRYRGRGWAIAALAGTCCFLGLEVD